jgi:hypothetical protein
MASEGVGSVTRSDASIAAARNRVSPRGVFSVCWTAVDGLLTGGPDSFRV